MTQQISTELPQLELDPTGRTANQQSAEVGSNYGEALNDTQAGKAIEQGTSAPSQAQAGAIAQQLAAAQQQAPAATNSTLPGAPQIADDTDLIEKEWVIKAKEIIARTKHDPYQQNKEVERMKVDYMKKRYNKDVKLTED